MHLHILQHVSFETPGSLISWADDRVISYTITELYRQDPHFPEMDASDVLIIMGGPMGVYQAEKYPWLNDEIRFIRDIIFSGHKVLGICLGAQLIAAALGKNVYPGPAKEIGFFPVNFSATAKGNPLFTHFGASYTAFHWHGDTFDLPDGAQLLASSSGCVNQAFLLNEHVIGLQFHLEIGQDELESMLLHGASELAEKGNYIQQAATIRSHASLLVQQKKDLYKLLDGFLLTPGISHDN
ncbi:MAG TPA: hypothetical protein VG842_01670 [Sediminibacterium sp.]|nr:hypothetical protein [Sediminibacterium sp.]